MIIVILFVGAFALIAIVLFGLALVRA